MLEKITEMLAEQLKLDVDKIKPDTNPSLIKINCN